MENSGTRRGAVKNFQEVLAIRHCGAGADFSERSQEERACRDELQRETKEVVSLKV